MRNIVNVLCLSLIIVLFSSCNESLADESCLFTSNSEFQINEKVKIFRTNLVIQTPTSSGKLIKEFWSMKKKFNLYMDGKYAGSGIRSIMHFGTEIMVYDCTGEYIGRIVNEEQIKNALSFNKIYSIYDSEDNLIVSSKKRNFIGANIDLYKDDELVANISRPTRLVSLKYDNWNIKIINQDVIDDRFLMFFAAFETYKRNKQEKSKRKKKKRSQ